MTRILNNIKYVGLVNSSGAMVEQSTHNSKFEGSNLATT
jgi:hypothetical protein